MSCTVLVLLTKGNADTWGIELIEVLWNVVDGIIETRIKTVVTFHDILNGFCACRGKGMAIADINMAQEIASIKQDPLFLVFLDLWKYYNTLECVRLLQN